MPHSFLIQYAREQFGYVPDVFTPEFVTAAKAAYNARNVSH